ncbi:hypothetical protein ACLOJK_002402 [Asimina triloba]
MADAKVECGLASNGTPLSACDKPQPVSGKKMALRELKEAQNIPRLSGNSPPRKDNGSCTSAAKVCGSKRSTPDCQPNSVCNQSACNNSLNGHLVYVRRKSETESSNTNVFSAVNAKSLQPIKPSSGNQESLGSQDQREETGVSGIPVCAPMPAASLATFSSGGPSVPNSLGKLHNGLAASESNCQPIATGAPYAISPQSQRASNRYWEERYLCLQTFLRSCDQSGQEEYIKRLRSLSAANRSREAYDLERRAILLSLEEVKEIQRMKVLNVLGKCSPKSPEAAAPPQSHFLNK